MSWMLWAVVIPAVVGFLGAAGESFFKPRREHNAEVMRVAGEIGRPIGERRERGYIVGVLVADVRPGTVHIDEEKLHRDVKIEDA